jgi:hypothetical protein
VQNVPDYGDVIKPFSLEVWRLNCHKCSLVSLEMSDVKDHFKTCPGVDRMTMLEDIFFCDKCASDGDHLKQFASISALKCHITRSHPESRQAGDKCYRCEKVYSSLQNLMRHFKATHQGEEWNHYHAVKVTLSDYDFKTNSPLHTVGYITVKKS